jgi:Tfp pilus assembly protein PilZ
MRLLTLAYPAAGEFLSAYDDATRTLRASTKTEAILGEPLLVEIAFPGLPNRPLLRATVKEVLDGALRLVIDEDDAQTREFLIRMAKGEVRVEETTHREHKRFPTALPVSWTDGGARHTSVVEDLSAGGCFVRAARRPQVGHQVSLDITAPDDITPLKLTGMVAWIRDGRDPGFGVEFDVGESADGKRLRRLLRQAIGSGDVDLEKA